MCLLPGIYLFIFQFLIAGLFEFRFFFRDKTICLIFSGLVRLTRLRWGDQGLHSVGPSADHDSAQECRPFGAGFAS